MVAFSCFTSSQTSLPLAIKQREVFDDDAASTIHVMITALQCDNGLAWLTVSEPKASAGQRAGTCSVTVTQCDGVILFGTEIGLTRSKIMYCPG